MYLHLELNMVKKKFKVLTASVNETNKQEQSLFIRLNSIKKNAQTQTCKLTYFLVRVH